MTNQVNCCLLRALSWFVAEGVIWVAAFLADRWKNKSTEDTTYIHRYGNRFHFNLPHIMCIRSSFIWAKIVHSNILGSLSRYSSGFLYAMNLRCRTFPIHNFWAALASSRYRPQSNTNPRLGRETCVEAIDVLHYTDILINEAWNEWHCGKKTIIPVWFNCQALNML